mgnify:FL=1
MGESCVPGGSWEKVPVLTAFLFLLGSLWNAFERLRHFKSAQGVPIWRLSSGKVNPKFDAIICVIVDRLFEYVLGCFGEPFWKHKSTDDLYVLKSLYVMFFPDCILEGFERLVDSMLKVSGMPNGT